MSAKLLALGLLAALCAFSQPKTKSAFPRLAGKPDFTGVWQPGNPTPGTWEEANSGNGLGGTGKNPNAPVLLASGDRTGPPAPYQDWAAAKVRDEFNRRGINDPASRCLPLGVPRIWSVSLFPVQMIQTPKQLVIFYEYMNLTRIIPIFPTAGQAKAGHRTDQGALYMGDSTAYWDGDVLVVDVNNFNDKTWLTGTGAFHTDALHVSERYTRVSKDRIDYVATMEDSGVLTKPWEYKQVIMLREGTLPAEYVCAENNLDPGRYEDLIKAGVKLERQ